jgi:DNA polymerase-1
MKVLLLDGYNMLYRARTMPSAMDASSAENNGTIYALFRSLRYIIDLHKPDRVYFVLEGVPRDRIAAHEEYKAQRVYHDRDGFQRQRKKVLEIISKYLPVRLARHPHYECDDVLASLAQHLHAEDECVIVSTDTDFYQIFSTCKNVKLYNPVKKDFVAPVEYDYVSYKALKGDSSDNIEGFNGIGDKRAKSLIENKASLEAFLLRDDNQEKFDKNCFLIRFHDLKDVLNEIQISRADMCEKELHDVFEQLNFQSIIKEPSWQKFVKTFNRLI